MQENFQLNLIKVKRNAFGHVKDKVSKKRGLKKKKKTKDILLDKLTLKMQT